MRKITMKLYDQHVHTYYSFDTDQSIEEYLQLAVKKGLSYFVVTDHLDLDYLDREDLKYDISLQRKELDNLQKLYPEITILQGVEIGYKNGSMERVKEYIKKKN